MDEELIWVKIAEEITQATGQKFEITSRQPVGGGCINQAYLISDDRLDRYFVKRNQSSRVEMFTAEAKGLLEMAATKTIAVPTPICWGVVEQDSYLVLNYLDLVDRPNSQSWQQMGRNLAAIHRYQLPHQAFGWHQHNTIGSTPQLNTWESDWATFFKNQRIGYQLQLAARRGGTFPKAAELLDRIPQILANHHPPASLVHGDLWGGNAGFTRTGIPVIFDPATYWGDREVDLAMTELFGGFPAAFYEGYTAVYSLDPGYSQRKILYNLYHILNHYNLFGGSYQHQANEAIKRLLS